MNCQYVTALFPIQISFLILVTGLLIYGCAPNEAVPENELVYSIPEQPELPTGYTPKPGWEFSEFAVAAANPLAVDAGYQILRAGGSAADAAVAVQLVLTLVEPQSSGIGGGAFMLHWDGENLQAINGRETAPAAADETLFLDAEGEPLTFTESVMSGLSVGVPGTLALLKTAHDEYGRLDWSDLFLPAITLAEEGFRISPRLHSLLDRDEYLKRDDVASRYYYNEDGNALPAGQHLRNPALAQIFREVAEEGILAFYEGRVAEDIARRVQNHPERPGLMTVEDISDYPQRQMKTEAICTEWNVYDICGFPPPSSGHLAIMQILGILSHTDAPEALQDTLPPADWFHYYMEAGKLAFADRNRYVADPFFVDPPAGDWASLLNPDYLASRADLIGEESMGRAEPGTPDPNYSRAGVQTQESGRGTSHISIVDSDGNAVAMTTTIEQGFGSRIMSDGGTGLTGGFHLNNELTDFSRVPIDGEGLSIANRVEAGKQPRSSMSPTLIFDRQTGRFVASTGSPGGAGIIHYTAKSILGMLQWELTPQEAIDLPNFANYNGPSLLESGRFPEETIRHLENRGHTVEERSMTSGLHTLQWLDGILYGGADPRREGVVKGQ